MLGDSNALPEIDSFRVFLQDPNRDLERDKEYKVAVVGLVAGTMVSGMALSKLQDMPETADSIQTTQAHIDQLTDREKSMRQNPSTTPGEILATTEQIANERDTLAELEAKYSDAATVSLVESLLLGSTLAVACGLSYLAIHFRSWRHEARQSISYQNEQRLALARQKIQKPQQASKFPQTQPKSPAPRSNVIPLKKKRGRFPPKR